MSHINVCNMRCVFYEPCSLKGIRSFEIIGHRNDTSLRFFNTMHVQTCQQMSINSTSHNGAHYCFHIQLSNSHFKRRNLFST